MMDYDSSDDEMATRLEGHSINMNIRSSVAEEGNGGRVLPNHTTTGDCVLPKNNANGMIFIESQAELPAATAPAPATLAPSSSTRKRHQDDDDDDDDDDDGNDTTRTKRSQAAVSTAKARPPLGSSSESSSSSTHRDHHHQDEETNETNHYNNAMDDKKQTQSPTSTTRQQQQRKTIKIPSCSKCGRFDFCTATGARRHEGGCDGTMKNPYGPWKLSHVRS
jgi:hypothetical protein